MFLPITSLYTHCIGIRIWKIIIIMVREKTMRFLKLGCNCGFSKKIPREKFAELGTAFQNLTRPEQDIFLMTQLKSEVTAS